MTSPLRTLLLLAALAIAVVVAWSFKTRRPATLDALAASGGLAKLAPEAPWRDKPLRFHQGWHLFTSARLPELARTYPGRHMPAFIAEVQAVAGPRTFLVYNDPLAVAFVPDRDGGAFYYLNFCGVTPDDAPLTRQLRNNLAMSSNGTAGGGIVLHQTARDLIRITLADIASHARVVDLSERTGTSVAVYDLEFTIPRHRGDPCQARVPLGPVPAAWAKSQK